MTTSHGSKPAPAGAPQRVELLDVDLAGTPAVERAQATRITLAPGQAPGSHHHPCDVVGIVVSGTIRFVLDGQDERVLRAGDAFFEPRDTHVLRFDNDSADEPATFVACYLRASGQDEVIVVGPPGATTRSDA